MLDNETKRRIDTARDILVGKVPDPKSQVEQITIALIYKFMDDIDAESEELGGKRKFFTNDFALYGWAKLMSPSVSGHELIGLYSEGISTMPQNPGIPPLFRDIFKNAYLPYRDPETLKSFLKSINEFNYHDSETLGDAFEYLLSIMGSQGDAGQFRTPRHIIDFIVEIIDPKKNEMILDPACGTAGFLISAYKHIIKTNKDAKNISSLTPDEKERVSENFKGYDISPDMVRLSLVNLYLHGFSNPHIYEYDTLTSEERWNKFADVILANPPFMTPKGGIKPHKRFSIKANRSEVLFVDYIAEHLSPTGRAGIIVPEGIIFQSQTAYKELRKMLVENYLVAVISLPAGVFQPYSGVKTSILILDKLLAKQSDTIAFFKIENDGFTLGAQRRANAGGQLTQVKADLAEYLDILRDNQSIDNLQPMLGLIVPKNEIAENGDYNLSGERYRKEATISVSFPIVVLGDVCDINKGTPITRDQVVKGYIPVIAGGQKPSCYHNTSNRTGETITVSASGAYAGFLAYFDEPIFASDCSTIKTNNQQLLTKFLFYLLKAKQTDIYALQTGMGQPHVYPKDLAKLQIPLPSREIQIEIVVEIESYQKIIDGARAVVDNYRPSILIDPECPLIELGDLCNKIQYGLSVPLNTNNLGFKIFRMNELVKGKCVDKQNMKYAEISSQEFKKYRLEKGDILFNRTNSFEHVGRAGIFDLEEGDYCFASYLIRLKINKEKANPFFINAFMNSDSFQQGIKKYASRAIGQANINAKSLSSYKIPAPSLIKQQIIIDEIEKEKILIDANHKLIIHFEKKIQTTLSRIWGENESSIKKSDTFEIAGSNNE